MDLGASQPWVEFNMKGNQGLIICLEHLKNAEVNL